MWYAPILQICSPYALHTSLEEEGFTKRRCSGGLVREGVWSVIIRCSVSFIIVKGGGGVIIIVIADRAVRGPEQTGLLAGRATWLLSLLAGHLTSALVYQGIPLVH